MKSIHLAILLLTTPALAKYDPSQDRAALRQSASASYDSASRAAAVPLLPERGAEIKSLLDDSAVQANNASTSAKNLETSAAQRTGEMAGELQGHGAPAPSSAASDLTNASATQRARWKSLSKDHDDLKTRADALASDNKDKSDLEAILSRSADFLKSADGSLTRAEGAAAAMTDAVAQMQLAQKRANGSALELTAADGEVTRLADSLPQPVSEAKDAVGLLGQEPQGPNRTRAGQKISVPHDITNQMFLAADRAFNRSDDYRSRSDAFDRAQAGFDAANAAGAGAPADAKASLDKSDAAQAGVKDRLDHPKP